MNVRSAPALALALAALAARAEDAKPSARPAGQGAPSGQETMAAAKAQVSGPGVVLAARSGSGGDSVLLALDLFANLFTLAADLAVMNDVAAHAPPPPGDEPLFDAPPGWEEGRAPGRAFAQRSSGDAEEQSFRPYRRRRDAREGFLFSFGLGGGGLRASPDKSIGAFDFGLRMGYGFSDRFQFFGDLSFDGAQYADGRTVSSWTLTARGQTVLAGDRDGNGLNLNLGFGLGGVSRGFSGCDPTYYVCYSGTDASSPVGLALASGLSYDARIGRSFSLSPELFATWHQVPNGPGRASDVASAVGLRLNFLWTL